MLKTEKTIDGSSSLERIRQIVSRITSDSKFEACERERREAMEALEVLQEEARAQISDFLEYKVGSQPRHAHAHEEYIALKQRIKAAEDSVKAATDKFERELGGHHARKVEAALYPFMAELAADILNKVAGLRSQLDAFDHGARELTRVGAMLFPASDSLSILEQEMTQVVAMAKTLSEKTITEKIFGR